MQTRYFCTCRTRILKVSHISVHSEYLNCNTANSTYNASDEVEVLGHHVMEVIGDEDSTHK